MIILYFFFYKKIIIQGFVLKNVLTCINSVSDNGMAFRNQQIIFYCSRTGGIKGTTRGKTWKLKQASVFIKRCVNECQLWRQNLHPCILMGSEQVGTHTQRAPGPAGRGVTIFKNLFTSGSWHGSSGKVIGRTPQCYITHICMRLLKLSTVQNVVQIIRNTTRHTEYLNLCLQYF